MNAALRTRQQHSTQPLWESLCPYDLATRMGLEVQFQRINSLEAIYTDEADPPIIIIGSLRPNGRQRYNAAHELGHHYFGHGTTIHELRNDPRPKDAKEFLADVYASFLLMPKLAMSKALNDRSIKTKQLSSEQTYTLACYFGVGYTTTILHLNANLQLISDQQADELRKTTPQQLRTILATDDHGELLVVDQHWKGRPADISVNDLLLLPHQTTVEGENITITEEREHGIIARAITPGISKVTNANWSLYTRVSRHEYQGRNLFRHDPEVA